VRAAAATTYRYAHVIGDRHGDDHSAPGHRHGDADIDQHRDHQADGDGHRQRHACNRDADADRNTVGDAHRDC
jgi:hypothetical protein